MVEPHSSNFRVITKNVFGVRIFRKFTVFISQKMQNHLSLQCVKAAKKASQALGFVKRNFSHFDRHMFSILYKTYEPRHDKTCLCHMPTTKAQISLHIRSVISAFVDCCLDSIIPLVSISRISSLYLVSVAEQAGLSLPWSQTPKTGFLGTRLIYKAPYGIRCSGLEPVPEKRYWVFRKASTSGNKTWNLEYNERLKALNLTTLEERRRRGDLIEPCKIITGKENIDCDKFFKFRDNANTKGHSMKIYSKDYFMSSLQMTRAAYCRLTANTVRIVIRLLQYAIQYNTCTSSEKCPIIGKVYE